MTARTTRYAATTTPVDGGIPSKFLLDKLAGPADGFASVTRPSGSEVTAVMTAGATSGAEAPESAPTPTSAKFRDDLPAPPEWFVGLLAGLLGFGLVVAVVLYLANFPPTFQWVHKLLLQQQKKYTGYSTIEQDDGPEGRKRPARSFEDSNRSSAYATSSAVKGSGSYRRRDLNINTSRRYEGLGIAIPGEHAGNGFGTPHLRRRSWDEEATRYRLLRPGSPAHTAWSALTAPLPTIAKFGHDVTEAIYGGPHTSALEYEASDLEMGTVRFELTPPTADMFDPDSPYHTARLQLGPETRAELEGFFGKIGGGVESVAGKVARALHEQVRSPEEGLLLPVRESEREQVSPPLSGV